MARKSAVERQDQASVEAEVWAVHMIHADIKSALLEDQDVAEYLEGKAAGFKTKAWDRMWQDMDAPLLETAARFGYPKTLAVLVGLGAAKTAKKQGRLEAALMMAMKARCAESAKLLVKAGADGKAKMLVKSGESAEMVSALDLATRQGMGELAALIEASAKRGTAKKAKFSLAKSGKVDSASQPEVEAKPARKAQRKSSKDAA